MAPSDDITYKEMVNYGVSYIESNNSTSNVIVEDQGSRLNVSPVNYDITDSDNWYLEETIQVNSLQYDSYFSTNKKVVALNLKN